MQEYVKHTVQGMVQWDVAMAMAKGTTLHEVGVVRDLCGAARRLDLQEGGI